MWRGWWCGTASPRTRLLGRSFCTRRRDAAAAYRLWLRSLLFFSSFGIQKSGSDLIQSSLTQLILGSTAKSCVRRRPIRILLPRFEGVIAGKKDGARLARETGESNVIGGPFGAAHRLNEGAFRFVVRPFRSSGLHELPGNL